MHPKLEELQGGNTQKRQAGISQGTLYLVGRCARKKKLKKFELTMPRFRANPNSAATVSEDFLRVSH